MHKFIIIVPVYNAGEWIARCIDSILLQDYGSYELIVIDDCSTDNTWDIIKHYPDRVRKFKNKKRIGSGLANFVQGIEKSGCNKEDIIVSIDGDDYLANNSVLTYLDNIYWEGAWLTYGSFLPLSGKYSGTCQPLEKARIVLADGCYDYITLSTQTYRRNSYWLTSHLKTFKKWLWDKIDDKDLRDEKGEYYALAWDMPFMYPMIEMAGSHVKFIERVLYMYNDLNPICIGNTTPMEQVKEGEGIQKKEIYKEL